MENNRKPKHVLAWAAWGFIILLMLGSFLNGEIISTFILAAAAILTLPLEFMLTLWQNTFKRLVTLKKTFIIIVMVFVALAIYPSDESTRKDRPKATPASTTVASATSMPSSTPVPTESNIPKTDSPAAEETAEATEQTDASATKITDHETASNETDLTGISAANLPVYSNSAYVVINNNNPDFSDADKKRSDAFETYSDLDNLGRCGIAYANICKDIMPTEKRGAIGSVKPTGWHTIKYDCVDGKYLYNRCHLIGYQLAGENANKKNLITGTRYLNVEGMLPFENMVADYVKETNHHVLYRVTPVFEGENLLCSGVQIEAYSVEDSGSGICFNVYCFNVQPGVEINYTTGDSKLGESTTGQDAETKKQAEEAAKQQAAAQEAARQQAAAQEAARQQAAAQEAARQQAAANASGSSQTVYITATGSKYHSTNHCGRTNPANTTALTEDEAINRGYEKCGNCW